jgi:hypothetical protein
MDRRLDRALLMSLAEKHGDRPGGGAAGPGWWPDNDPSLTGDIDDLDDFAACRISRMEDWIDLYAKPFYFGCEADDRTNAWAFSRNNPFGSKLNAIYSSDIGHFDVIDMRDPLPRPTAGGVVDQQRQLPRLHVCQPFICGGRTRGSSGTAVAGRPRRSWRVSRTDGGEVGRGEDSEARPRAGLRPPLF